MCCVHNTLGYVIKKKKKMFVCFKGRIEPLPDESNPYLQSSPGTNETRGRLNGLCSHSTKLRTPSTQLRCIRSLGLRKISSFMFHGLFAKSRQDGHTKE